MDNDDSETFSGIKNLDLTLLANFVHQVINPMNGVAGTLDNLADGTISEQRRVQRTNAARAQLEGCITLVRNLAFLVSDPVSVAQSELKTIVLPQIVIEAAMFYQEQGKRRGIEINLSDRKTQNRVSAHPELIRQVLMNIFDNCIKYSRRETEVVVHQRIRSATGQAIFEITSTSKTPVTNKDIERIFELGYRGENARSTIASGTGLGMYVCKQLIEDVHGGSITVQRHRDGLQFLIQLPGGH